MRHFIVYFLLVTFFVHNPDRLLAQNNYKQVNTLNIYVSYINESIHALWMMQRELDEYNQSLVHYYNIRKGRLRYKNYSFLTMSSAYNELPSSLYDKCIRKSKVFSKRQQNELNRELEKLNAVLNEIQDKRNAISKYTVKGVYFKEPELTGAFKLLEQCSKLYDDFESQKCKLYQKLQQIYIKYEVKDTANQYVTTAIEAYPILELALKITDEVKDRDIESVKALSKELSTNVKQFESRKAVNLKGLQSMGGKTNNDPFVRYDRIVINADSVQLQTVTYLLGNSYSTVYDKGRDYYYFNERFVKHLNRYGGGLIYQYNRFIDLSEIPVLKMAERTHWFMVKYPKKREDKEEVIADNNMVVTPEPKEDIEPDPASLRGFSANNLVFLLDISGSMNAPDKLPVLKDAVKYLLTLMRPKDYVAIVSYSGAAKTELESTSATHRQKIENVIDSLFSSGGSDVKKGLKLSYNVVGRNYMNDANNKIILVTDGILEITDKCYDIIKKGVENDIRLSVFYLNRFPERSIEETLARLAEAGQGNFIHVKKDNAKEVLLKEAQSLKHREQ